MKEATSGNKPLRLASLDALRGFDMFFITGGSALIAGLCKVLDSCGWLGKQMYHVPWEGFAHHDTIFPLFLFLAGVSWPFSLAAQRARGASTAGIYLKILRRTAGLFLLGLAFGGILRWNPAFRLMSVLGFIGLSWGAGAALYILLEKKNRWLWAAAAIAAGYFALLHFVPFPGLPADADIYSKQWNIIRFLDITVYPGHLLATGKPLPYEPESLFSVPSGAVLAMLGMFAGNILNSRNFTAPRKALILGACSLGSLLLTFVFVYPLGVPIVKALWTVSFISAAAAYSFAMLAIFYWIVDIRGWKAWTAIFDPVGKNSILAYTLLMTGVSRTIHRFLFNGTLEQCGDWALPLSGLTGYLVIWAIVRFLGKKGIYIKL